MCRHSLYFKGLIFFQAPEVGLLAPDLVIYLDISPEVEFSHLEVNAIN